MAARNPKPQQPPEPEPTRAHSAEALQRVWDAQHARRAHATQLAEKVDAVDDYIGRTRAALARAETDRRQVVEEHAATLAEADELRAMVVGHCERNDLPLPKDPASEPPAIAAPVPGLDDRARKHPAPVARAVSEIVQHTDPYAHLLGQPVKVLLRDQIEVYAGTLHSLDNGQGRLVLLDLATREPYWWPERSLVERIEPLNHEDHDDRADTRPDDPYGGDPLNEYGQLPGRPAEARPDVGIQPPTAEARALAVRPATSRRLAAGVWLASRSVRRRQAWARTGHWRHRAGALHGAVRSAGAVRGVTV